MILPFCLRRAHLPLLAVTWVAIVVLAGTLVVIAVLAETGVAVGIIVVTGIMVMMVLHLPIVIVATGIVVITVLLLHPLVLLLRRLGRLPGGRNEVELTLTK
jgi:hypothetical protein